MAKVDISRLSIGATRDIHDVGYTMDGLAYCKRINHHHWKYGDEHWADRSKSGYITFGDRHLGMAVEHSVEVLPGESYIAFWSRIRRAEDLGYIETGQTTAYSSKDKAILEAEGIPRVTVKVIEEGAMSGGLSPSEEKAWLAQNKQDTDEPGVISKSSQKIAGIGVIGIAVIVALGYLILGGRK